MIDFFDHGALRGLAVERIQALQRRNTAIRRDIFEADGHGRNFLQQWVF
jgi:hypothetical protein